MFRLSIFIVSIFIVVSAVAFGLFQSFPKYTSGAPPYGIPEEKVPDITLSPDELKRPDGPVRVGLQVGHWKNDELPEELSKLRDNDGAYGGGKWEWEVNYKIASLTAELLRKKGITVDILPATVPVKYRADVFVAIHADDNPDKSKSGYKFSGPWRDVTGKADTLVGILEKKYEAATGLKKDDNITKNMRGYYAFSWWRFEHAIHPSTVGVIAETGFLSNKSDQRLLIYSPQISAKAISEGISEYLTSNILTHR